MFRLAIVSLLLLVAACAADPKDARDLLPEPVIARGMEFTRTHAVNFGDDTRPAGYLVEFLRVPNGVVDERVYSAGTALIQDALLADVGFVSPAGAGYRFEGGGTAPLGFAARTVHVTTLLGGEGRPALTPVDLAAR